MLGSYKIIKEGTNKYVFFTKEGIEYQLVIKPSGMVFEDDTGNQKNIIELALNCDTNTASKDYRTVKTLVRFSFEIAARCDVVYMQIHNQPEWINNERQERRGVSRVKLWNRLITKNFSDYIMLTNLSLDPNKKNDILSIVIKKDSNYFKEYVKNFYRFCHSKMYAPNT